jgi:hypothetical protein
MSYLNVFGVGTFTYGQSIAIGDIVAVGPNQYPQFEVMATRGEMAWLRDTTSGLDGIVVTSRCRRIA